MGARGKAGKEADLPGFNFVIVFVLIENLTDLMLPTG